MRTDEEFSTAVAAEVNSSSDGDCEEDDTELSLAEVVEEENVFDGDINSISFNRVKNSSIFSKVEETPKISVEESSLLKRPKRSRKTKPTKTSKDGFWPNK